MILRLLGHIVGYYVHLEYDLGLFYIFKCLSLGCLRLVWSIFGFKLSFIHTTLLEFDYLF